MARCRAQAETQVLLLQQARFALPDRVRLRPSRQEAARSRRRLQAVVVEVVDLALVVSVEEAEAGVASVARRWIVVRAAVDRRFKKTDRG